MSDSATPGGPAFCSYSRHDAAFAMRLARDLKARGASVWLDQLDIDPGQRWDRAVEKALANCSCMILVLSPDSIASDNVMDEVSYMLETQRKVIPVLHSECAIPFRLRRLQHVDFRDQYDQALTATLTALGVTEQSNAYSAQIEAAGRSSLASPDDLKDEPPAPDEMIKAAQPGRTKVNPRDGLTYVWVAPGTFSMGGSPGDSECRSDERPAHQVTINEGFWLAQTPVTQAAYLFVTGKNPSNFKGPNLPAEHISWEDAQKCCAAIGGRLPTEAEWEYAARAGNPAARYGDLDRIAWYANNSGNKTHDVARKDANAWGFYDMLGNVWEWTSDWYGSRYYQSSETADPQGPPSGEYKTLRGGSWVYDPADVRVSLRHRGEPGDSDGNFGFRCIWKIDGFGYLEKRRADIDYMLAALDHGDFQAIVGLGHKLAGTGSGYGFPEITEIGSAIEKAARAANAAKIRSCLQDLDLFLTALGIDR
jgi:formylglycine-generating enzyme required for sulfatase activity